MENVDFLYGAANLVFLPLFDVRTKPYHTPFARLTIQDWDKIQTDWVKMFAAPLTLSK
jgi:hypothetical protein